MLRLSLNSQKIYLLLILLTLMIISLVVLVTRFLTSPVQKTTPLDSQANQPKMAEFPAESGNICTCPAEGVEQVCGDDFMSYSSACEANCYGVQVVYVGACKLYDPDAPLPTTCTSCGLTCPTNYSLYLDADGCPVCECKPAPFETEVEGNE